MSTFARGSGQRNCKWPAGCGRKEIEGLEYCLQHVPDDLLDEAEDITGIRRCRYDFGQPGACRKMAASGVEPPRCEDHGANRGSMARLGGAMNVRERDMAERLAAIMQLGGEKLLHPDPIQDPLTELLDLAAEVKALKEVLRYHVAELVKNQRVRYAHAKAGEQMRAEILLYERAVERTAKIMIDISKLRIEDRLAGVQEATAQMLERAIDAALQESGVGLDGIGAARKAFRRHLKVVQGELAS